MSKKMWCRVGVEITLTDEEYKDFIKAYKENDLKKSNYMLTNFLKNRAKLDGETYFPSSHSVGNCYNNLEEEMDFLL